MGNDYVMRVEPSWMESVSLYDTPECFLTPSAMGGHREKTMRAMNPEEDPLQTLNLLVSGSWSINLQSWEKCLRPQPRSVVLCDSRPSLWPLLSETPACALFVERGPKKRPEQPTPLPLIQVDDRLCDVCPPTILISTCISSNFVTKVSQCHLYCSLLDGFVAFLSSRPLVLCV